MLDKCTLSANGAGCFFPGRSLVDGTGSLSTLRIQAQRAGISPQEAYPLAIRLLVDRLLAFSPQRVAHPNILLLHASHESTSNTLDLARALAAPHGALLMDEPFGALDAVTRARLQDMVLELWRKQEPKKTVFFVTHDVDEAILLSTKIFVLGQSPSNVIFSCDIPSDGRPTRETQFEDPKFLNLRNTLIRYINQDVASRIS